MTFSQSEYLGIFDQIKYLCHIKNRFQINQFFQRLHAVMLSKTIKYVICVHHKE